MKKRPILFGFIAFAIEEYTLSLITNMCGLSKTVSEGVFSVLIMATALLTIWFIVKRLSKNKPIAVKTSFLILLIIWIINILFYIEDYLL